VLPGDNEQVDGGEGVDVREDDDVLVPVNDI
jgi:hypothetical protein